MNSVRRDSLSTLALLLVALLVAFPAQAELVLTAPPREDVQAGKALYGPFAEHLSKVLGEEVVYRHPNSWPEYERRMKNDEFDIVFDGPHFAAWRIQNLENEPVARLPGSLEFVLAVRAEDPVRRPRDLVGERVCTLPPPNLAGLTVYGMFPNPAQQPDFVVISRGGFREIARAFEADRCRAAIYRKAFYENQLSAEAKAGLRVIQASEPLLNQGVTVSRRIAPAQREALAASLSTGEGLEAIRPVLQRFGGNARELSLAGARDYEGHNLLHDQMVFGW